jgi:hypothetical protein
MLLPLCSRVLNEQEMPQQLMLRGLPEKIDELARTKSPTYAEGRVRLLDKLDKFRVQNTSQSKCNPMRERAIACSGRFDLDRRPPGPTPGGQRL